MNSLKIIPFLLVVCVFLSVAFTLGQGAQEPIRIIVIGAHPDDPEEVGGTMAKFIQLGHKVRLVSMTNGNAGHFEEGGGPLAQRRYKEAQCAGKVIGAEYVVLDNDDGELMPTLENREKVIWQIRDFRADIVIAPRPNDYHPDHRNTGLLVRDAAYMVTVPNIVPSVPHLRKNPIFIYTEDRFSVPTPFTPDIVVDIGSVIEKKIDMYHCHTSQMYEWLPYNAGYLDSVPEDPAERRAWLGERWGRRSNAEKFRSLLIELYGSERGSKVKFAEAFQVSEYGRQPSLEQLKKLFPFFD